MQHNTAMILSVRLLESSSLEETISKRLCLLWRLIDPGSKFTPSALHKFFLAPKPRMPRMFFRTAQVGLCPRLQPNVPSASHSQPATFFNLHFWSKITALGCWRVSWWYSGCVYLSQIGKNQAFPKRCCVKFVRALELASQRDGILSLSLSLPLLFDVRPFHAWLVMECLREAKRKWKPWHIVVSSLFWKRHSFKQKGERERRMRWKIIDDSSWWKMKFPSEQDQRGR